MSLIDAEIESLKTAVERLHSCTAELLSTEPVLETFKGSVVWDGAVRVFKIKGHPTASKCYAWSSPIEGSSNRKFYAVLHQPPVDSPLAAVRASIVKDFKESGK